MVKVAVRADDDVLSLPASVEWRVVIIMRWAMFEPVTEVDEAVLLVL